MDGRIKHIDVAKGISITLVAMFHSKLRFYFPEIIEPMALFRMPLFFMLSGVFFEWDTSPKEFIIKKSEALLKPYFSVLFIILFIDFLLGGDALTYQLKGIFYGNGDTIKWTPLWFLTHLFAVYVFSYLVFRYGNLKKIGISALVLLVVFIVVGSIFVDCFWYQKVDFFSRTIELPGLPFSVDIVLITSSYFILGRLLKNSFIYFRPEPWACVLSFLVFLMVSQFTDAHIDLNKRVYDSPVYATLGALCGMYMIISLSYFISKSFWLSVMPLRLGQASLYILIFHVFITGNFFNYFSNDSFSESHFTHLAFVSFALGVLIPLIIKWLVERNDILSLAFLPFKSNKLLQRTIYAPLRKR